MLKIGLTGGIGSGKSTVAKIFEENNINVIDADKIAREVLEFYPTINKKIRMSFGNSFFDNEGNLKRKQLGNFIFSDKSKQVILENIILPYIKKEIFSRFDKYNIQGEKICILDAPTLIEQGLNKQMDYNVLVYVDIQTQFERIKKRDGLTEKEIRQRIEAQISLDEKKKIVDFVIDNTKDRIFTKEQVNDIINRLRQLQC